MDKLNEYLQPINSPATQSRGDVSSLDFDLNYDLPLGNVNYSNITASSRPYTAIVSPSREQGTFNDIQEAINYVNRIGGGTVYTKNGIYFPKDELILYSNIRLIGESTTETILDFSNSLRTTELSAIKAFGTQVTTDGTFSINTGSSIVTGSSSQFSTDSVLAGDDFYINNVPYEVLSVSSNTSLTLVEIFHGNDVAGQAVRIERSLKNVFVENISTINNGDYGIQFLRVINGGIKFCNTQYCDVGISAEGYQVEVSFNSSRNNNSDGMAVGGNSVDVFNNFVENNAEQGISLAFANKIVIANNHISNNDISGISSVAVNDVIFSNNIISGNDFRGIFIGQGSNRCMISANSITSSGDDAIEINGTFGSPTNKIVVTGNVTNGEAVNGIQLTSNTTNCVVVGNTTSGGISDSGSNTVANNT